jgi:signal peptide peptidase SppA
MANQKLMERRSAGAAATSLDSYIPFSESKAAQILGIGEYWAIEPRYRDAALANLSAMPVADCLRFIEEAKAKEAAEVSAAADRQSRGEPDPKPYEMSGRTAIVRIKGTMTKSQSSWGGTGTVRMSRVLRAAEKDRDVDAIAMVLETPGGECRGGAEFAEVIRAVNAKKPIYMYGDDMCASMGYFAASQGTAIYMNRMGLIGCIGTISVAEDMSLRAQMMGIKVLVFSSEGAETYKGAGTDGTPITPEQQAYFQSIVDHFGNDFKAMVKGGRGFTDDQVKSVATGKLFTSAEALELGLIDGVASFDDFLQMISAGSVPARKTAASNGTGEPTMSNGTKPSLADRIMAIFKEEGIDTQAGGGSNPPVDAATKAALDLANERIAKADEAVAKSLVETACAHLGADTKAAVQPLALLAVKADGGEIGDACKAFQSLAVAGKTAIDMRSPMLLQLAQQPGVADDLKKQTERAMSGAVAAINNGGM